MNAPKQEPQVSVSVHEDGQVSALCHWPACDWSYGPAASAKTRRKASEHRRRHREVTQAPARHQDGGFGYGW